MPPDAPSLSFVIVGTPRSGTTLVQALVSRLRGVVVPPETHYLSLFGADFAARHPHGADPSDTRAELERYATSRHGANLDVDAVAATVDDAPVGPLRLYRAIVAALAPEAEVLGEKTPDHLLWWRPLTDHDASLRVIWVLRDPRAVVASNRAVPFGMDRDALNAQRWVLDHQQLVAARHALGARLLVTRYEEVVAHPRGAQRAFAELLGRDPDDLIAEPIQALRHEHETWKQRVDEPPTTARVDAWRHVLSDREVGLVEAIVGPDLEAAGYARTATRTARLLGALTEPPGDRLRRARLRRARRERLTQIEQVSG